MNDFYTEGFQLLEARVNPFNIEERRNQNRFHSGSYTLFNEEPQFRDDKRDQYITSIIGKNGTGKSHLLSSIVQTFVFLEEMSLGKHKSASNLPLHFLKYRLGGRIYTVSRGQRNEIGITVDGNSISPRMIELPKQIVALTVSPFDKFPIPRLVPHSMVQSDPSIYHYLGLRDRFGKASIESLLFRSLISLFDTNNSVLRETNIGAVFEFLGLQPILTVTFGLRVASSVRNAIVHGHSLHDALTRSHDKIRMESVERSGVTEPELRDLLLKTLHAAKSGRIQTTADFTSGNVSAELFTSLQPLRRAGFLRLNSVEVTQKNGQIFDLRRASSGQLSMVSALLALASVITNGSLVLIDEPEISLHPEWQVKYIDMLLKTFSRYRGCHFVIATHSPLVVSELPKNSNILSLDDEKIPEIGNLSGKSVDFLLAEAFDLPTNGNLHVKEQIVSALRLVADGKSHSNEFKETLKKLQRISPFIEHEDPIRTIIDNLQDVADSAGASVRT